jgi:cell division protein FtsB
MTNTALSGNRHPVDRLADVRAEIKKLQDEETDLKEQIGKLMGSADSLGGDEFIAGRRCRSARAGSTKRRCAAS